MELLQQKQLKQLNCIVRDIETITIISPVGSNIVYVRQLKLQQWYSRPHIPKDNPVLERLNRTIQEVFTKVTDVDLVDTVYFNEVLLEWLIDLSPPSNV